MQMAQTQACHLIGPSDTLRMLGPAIVASSYLAPKRIPHDAILDVALFSDGVVDAARNRLVTVMEDHSGEGEAANSVASVGAISCNMPSGSPPVLSTLLRPSSRLGLHCLLGFMSSNSKSQKVLHQPWDQLVPYLYRISRSDGP